MDYSRSSLAPKFSKDQLELDSRQQYRNMSPLRCKVYCLLWSPEVQYPLNTLNDARHRHNKAISLPDSRFRFHKLIRFIESYGAIAATVFRFTTNNGNHTPPALSSCNPLVIASLVNIPFRLCDLYH
ncbi:unnamed protein product [Nezara viridula]|uniref:Uncharacterized protein n=1 Tax=Nezara viridula TaxID=85310 RepID=A0A9P0HLW7_NEZVI|nr:unnamed protein product [Nezara viridula]